MGGLIKIMLVEDDPYTCERFEHDMRRYADMELVYRTDSQRAALAYLMSNDVDFVILDLELKEGDGLSFMEELKELDKEKPFIFVVTNTMSEVTLDMVRANGSDYIYQKTNLAYTPNKILSLIDKIFVYKRALRTMGEKKAADYLIEQENARLTQQLVNSLLTNLGFSTGKLGTCYLQDILEKVVNEGEVVSNSYMTKLYQEVAEMHHTGAINVERNIRSAIASTWKHSHKATLERFYPYPWDRKKGKPTNREFIINMADRLTTK